MQKPRRPKRIAHPVYDPFARRREPYRVNRFAENPGASHVDPVSLPLPTQAYLVRRTPDATDDTGRRYYRARGAVLRAFHGRKNVYLVEHRGVGAPVQTVDGPVQSRIKFTGKGPVMREMRVLYAPRGRAVSVVALP